MKYPINRIRNNSYHYMTVFRRLLFRKLYNMDIGENTRISGKARLDRTNPKGIHIGQHSSISLDAVIISHDFVNNKHVDTYIGDYCFVGAKAIVMPGVRIGNHCIIGAGSVVMNDIPDYSMATGNPARIVRSNIMTLEYGILDANSLRNEVKSKKQVSKSCSLSPNTQVIEIFSREINKYDSSMLDIFIVDAGIDSFELVSIRAAIETELKINIPGAEWGAIRKLKDILLLPSLLARHQETSENKLIVEDELSNKSATPDISINKLEQLFYFTEPGRSNKTYNINMPQMALSGLSESWLFKELGDIHWGMIMEFLKTPSSGIIDDVGDRLYATFTRISLQLSRPLFDFDENNELNIKSRLSRYGAGLFFCDHEIFSESANGRCSLMSSFAKYGERGKNTSLMKGVPTLPSPELIPPQESLPAFGLEYREKRNEKIPDVIFESVYDIIPPHDINGVGLLYFAAYPIIFDLCIAKYEGDDFLFSTSTISKDVYYFANSEPTEKIKFLLHERDSRDQVIRHSASLIRSSDNKRMAYIESSKSIIKNR